MKYWITNFKKLGLFAKISILFILLNNISNCEIIQWSTIDNVLNDTRFYGIAATGSMEPTLNENYIICVKNTPFLDIKIGDIIIYHNKRLAEANGITDCDLICHRVINRSSAGSLLITKGDANQSVDIDWVTKEMYAGEVVAIIKKPKNG